MANRAVTYTISPTNVNLKGFTAMDNALTKVSRTATRATTSVVRSFSRMTSNVVRFSARTVAVLGGLTVAGAGLATKMAANAEEVENKFQVSFAGITDAANDWINDFARSVGRSRNETKQLLTDSEDLLTGFGATRQQAFELSTQIQSLGVDLASFNNLQDPDAVNRLRKGLLGETENLKALGIIINQNILQQEAQRQGYSSNLKELDELTKIQLRYNIAQRQSRNAIGDAERSLGSLTNQTKAVRANLTDIAVTLGNLFIPAATKATTVLNNKLSDAFSFIQTTLSPVIETLSDTAGIFFRLLSFIGDETRKALGIGDISVGDTLIGFFQRLNKVIENVTSFLFENRTAVVGFLTSTINFVKQIGTTAFDVVADIIRQLTPIIQSAIGIIRDQILPILVPVFRGLSTILAPVVDHFIVSMEIILGAVSSILSNVSGELSPFASGIGTLFQGISRFISELLVPVMRFIGDILNGTVIPAFLDWVGVFADITGSNLNVFVTELKDLFNVLKPAITEAIGPIGDVWNTFVKSFADGYRFLSDRIVKPLFRLFGRFARELLPPIIGTIGPIVNEYLPILNKGFKSVMETIGPVIDFIIGALEFAAPFIINTLKAVIEFIKDAIVAVIRVLNGVITFLQGVFTGDWELIWEGVKLIFSGVFKALGAVLSGALNVVIGLINGLTGKLNALQVDIPEWVPFIGGETLGFEIPEIPMLQTGTDFFQGGTAVVGEAGPELVNLPRGSQVINNRTTENILQSTDTDSIEGLLKRLTRIAALNATVTTADRTTPTQNIRLNVDVNVDSARVADPAVSREIIQNLRAPVRRIIEQVFREMHGELALEG